MAISTEKELQASERFMLVKITPARYLGVDDWDASLGGGQYFMTFPFQNLSAIKRNGSALTKVTSLTGNDQYTFNESTRLLTIQLASAPDITDNVVIAFHDLFFTGNQARYYPEDPESAESSSNPLVCWEPRLLKYPGVSKSIKNIISGILSYSNTSLSFANEDDFFNQYLTIDDSFSNKDVQIWQVINSIANIKRVYSGKCKNINISGSRLNISVLDPMSALNTDAFFGDTDEKSIFQRSFYFPNLNPGDVGKPNRYWTAQSRHKLLISDTTTVPLQYIDNAEQAICSNVSLDSEPTTSNNRSYYCCRVGGNGLKTLNFGTTSANAAVGSNARAYAVSGDNLYYGDQFVYSGNTFIVLYRGSNFSYSGTKNCVVACTTAATLPPTNLAVVTPAQTPPVIYYKSGNDLPITFWWNVDYSWGATTAGVNLMINIGLASGANSPETNWGISSPIDPNSGNLYFMVQPADSFTHAEFIEKMCEDAGLTVNAASFTQADSDLTANVHVSVPNMNENEYQPVSKYIEDVLKSTLGYININDDFEVEYHLLDTPNDTGEQVSNDYVIKDSLSENIDYNDVTTTFVATNPHVPIQTGDDGYVRTDSYKYRYLHEADKTIELEHCLDDISGRIYDIAKVRGSRRHTYNFDVATQLIDAEIGDDITLTDKSKNLKITSLKKDGSKISVEADDLGDL